jgi:hypothetical protein
MNITQMNDILDRRKQMGNQWAIDCFHEAHMESNGNATLTATAHLIELIEEAQQNE